MDSIVRRSKELYGPYLDKEMRAQVDALSVGDQAYFWSYLWNVMPRMLEKSNLREMERRVAVAAKRVANPSPTPFRDAEGSIHAGSWFRSGRLLS